MSWSLLEGLSNNGGGGIRTPVWFPTHRFRGGPVRPTPAPLLVLPWLPYQPQPSIGAPGFEPGTSATRTQRSTGLSHAPNPTGILRTTVVSSCDPTKNGRGGIRTHVSFRPHDFQSCALSRSATRPSAATDRPDIAARGQRREWDSNPRGPFGPTP